MSEGSKARQRPGSLLGKKSLSTNRTLIEGAASGPTYSRESAKSRKTARVLSELPKNQIKQKTGVLKGSQSKSNIDLTLGTNEADLGGKILSCENVSRIVKISKIPRATGGRKFGGESRLTKVGEPKKRVERPTEVSFAKENVGHFEELPGTSNDSAESPVLTESCQKFLLGKSDSCESKQSSGEFFDDSLGQVSDDEIIDISGDITIRKEALDIAVKLAARTPTEIEDSSVLGFPELVMLDILGGSDLNLNVQKNELPFAIFEEMDNITDSVNQPEEVSMESAVPVASARSPSPMEELPLSSRTPNAPVSIITSITSIMSLDTGYQGDGELSRPESRSAEVDSRLKIPHAESGVQVKSIQFDDSKTMTDSDFFTESDADIHDDLSAAAAEIGSGKGDRKAQVIDGTLYGGVNIHKNGFIQNDGDNRTVAQDCVNAPFNDDMASSGIFSDVEKKPEDSFRMEEDPPEKTGQDEDGIQNNANAEEERKPRPEASEGMVKSSSAESSSTIQEMMSAAARTSSVVSAQDSERSGQKPIKTVAANNKMPNRNVTSKVKVLIETSKTKPETVTRPKTVRKGKWDAVMDRIAQGKEENKYTPTRFRDVKSKVYQSAKPLFNAKSDETDANKTSANSLQSKIRRRNVRLRSSDSPLVSAKTSRKATSPNSSQRSSISDISVSAAVNKQKLINETNQNGLPAKSSSTTVINPVTNNINNNNNNNNSIANNKHKVKTIKMVQKKSSPLPLRSKDSVQQKNGGLHIRTEEKTVGLLKQLRHNCKAFESFAVLLGYCIEDLDAFSTPKLKLELETERERYRESQSRLEEVEHHLQEQLVSKIRMINDLEKENRDLVEKTEEFTSLVESLKYEQNSLMEKLSLMEEEFGAKIREKEETEEELKRENQELAYRVEESNKTYSVLKKMYDKVKAELTVAKEAKVEVRQRREASAECGGKGDMAPDRLESEVESLRQVLALKTDEVSELRRQELFLRENADRVPKLVSTITLLEGKVEDFHMQLSSQIEANRELEKRNCNLEEELKVANVQKMRLTQKNEELQYKLKQYADALRQLVSQKNLTEDDIRNVYLYPKTPQKGDCSVIVDSLAAQMKGVVQKSDSVSYMLEMKEDSSEIVTNIIRRAESMRYASRSQTLPKKKRPKTYSVSSMEALSPFDDYITGNGEKAGSSSTKFTFPEVDSPKAPKKKVVKLHPNDFVPDGIELAGDESYEIIEITKSFDRGVGKTEEGIMNEMSCSSCSSSSDNGNQFDIESDVYSNARESDEGRETEKESDHHVGASYSADESAEDISGFPEDGKCGFSGNVPKTSGGEALIASGDDTRSNSP